jgi:hypothetical protein
MGKRTVELDEPVMNEQSQALQNAVERAERAEAELAKLKQPSKTSSKSGDLPFEGTSEVPRRSKADEAEKDAPRGTSSTAHADHSGKHLVEPGSMDRGKGPAAQNPEAEAHPVGEPQVHGLEALREDSMMAHLLDALDRGEDIGHYGRLVFAMIARHFLTDEEVLAELTKDQDFGEEEARQMLVQVEGRDYSPPRRNRIMEWQAEQEFPIIPNANDPDCGNVYKSLRFSKETYSHIGHYQEEKASS